MALITRNYLIQQTFVSLFHIAEYCINSYSPEYQIHPTYPSIRSSFLVEDFIITRHFTTGNSFGLQKGKAYGKGSSLEESLLRLM